MRRAFALVIAISILAVLRPAVVTAQIPDKFKNLQVLPKDITKDRLVATMRAFTGALGVRCAHCHVSTDPQDLKTYDWASDDKDAKEVARKMMTMTSNINQYLGKELATMRPERLEVGCFTCHHGNSRPETLGQSLAKVMKRDGIDSTLTAYRKFRNDYYGQAVYDFSEWSLISIGEEMAKEPAQRDAAIRLLALNLEFYPKSAGTYARMAEIHVAAGDTTEAIKDFNKAVELAPDDPWIKRRVDQVKSKKK